MQKLVLHICCGHCGIGVIEKLSSQFTIVGYFYNPNIWPQEEYERRLDSAKKVGEFKKIEMISGPYEYSMFEENVKHLANEKEGSKRCLLCYRIRLEKTAILAKEKWIELFATTLSISPHKNAEVINNIGKEVARIYGLNFYEEDFKKDNGFLKSIRLSLDLGLYRQKYCGCQYSATTKI